MSSLLPLIDICIQNIKNNKELLGVVLSKNTLAKIALPLKGSFKQNLAIQRTVSM